MDQRNIEYNIPKLSLKLSHLCFSKDDGSFQYKEEYTTSSHYFSPNSLIVPDANVRIGTRIEYDYEWLASRNIAVEPWSDAYVWFKDATVPFDKFLDGGYGNTYSSMRLMYEYGTNNLYQIGLGTKTNPDFWPFADNCTGSACNMHCNISKYHISIELRAGKKQKNPCFVYTLTEQDCPDPHSYTYTVEADRRDFPNMILVFGSNRAAYQISNLLVDNVRISKFSYASPDAQEENLVIFGTSNYQNIHFHKDIELVQVQTESVDCYVNGDQLHLTPNQILLINHNIYHQIQPCEKNTKVTILNFDAFQYLDKEELGMNSVYAFLSKSNTKPYQLYEKQDVCEFFQILQNISDENSRRKPAYQVFIKSNLLRIVAYLLREQFLCNDNQNNDESLDKIVPIIQYINKHFTEKISLDQISKAISLDKYYICKIFRSRTNSTIVDYINFLRLSYAVEQLQHINLSISEIAYGSGFSSIQNFNYLFKQHYNCTPSEYRKRIL